MSTILGGIAVVAGTFYATMTGIAAIQSVITTLKARENVLSLKGLAIAAKDKAIEYGGAAIKVIGGAFKSFGAIPIIGGVLAAAAAAAGIAYLATQSKKADDIMSPGYGKRILSAPEGTFALNDKDTVVAGTDLDQGSSQPTSSPSINLTPLVEQMNAMNATLSAILNKEGTVMLDSTKVGTALSVGSYKLQ